MSKDKILTDWYEATVEALGTTNPIPLEELKCWSKFSLLDIMCPDVLRLPPILLAYAKSTDITGRIIALLTYAMYHYTFSSTNNHLHAFFVVTQNLLLEETGQWYTFKGVDVRRMQRYVCDRYAGADKYGVMMDVVKNWISFHEVAE